MVTFSPVEVEMVKPDVDRLPTVPVVPPAAGPERALDPPPPEAFDPPPLDPRPPPGRDPPAGPLPGTECPAVAEEDVADGDVARPMESPITAHNSAAATIHPLILFVSNRHVLDQNACWAPVVAADGSGEDTGGRGGAAPPSELPATSDADIGLEPGPAGRVSRGPVGS
jgi:hypothetical protein